MTRVALLPALATVAALTVALGASTERAAHAYAACFTESGWALPADASVPVHPELVYATASYRIHGTPTAKATIDGKAVKSKTRVITAGDRAYVVVAVESPKPGKLAITWTKAKPSDPALPNVTYVIAKLAVPKIVTGTTSRFHVAYDHSTVHELEDGLQVAVDADAVRFVATWRRDAQAAWTTVDMVALTRDGHQVLHLGEIGCASNFSVPLLERGLELKVTAILADGSAVAVAGLPAQIVLPKLPANAPQSSP